LKGLRSETPNLQPPAENPNLLKNRKNLSPPTPKFKGKSWDVLLFGTNGLLDKLVSEV